MPDHEPAPDAPPAVDDRALTTAAPEPASASSPPGTEPNADPEAPPRSSPRFDLAAAFSIPKFRRAKAASPVVETEPAPAVESEPAPAARRLLARLDWGKFPLANARRETRVGVAALASFLILVAALVVNHGTKAKGKPGAVGTLAAIGAGRVETPAVGEKTNETKDEAPPSPEPPAESPAVKVTTSDEPTAPDPIERPEVAIPPMPDERTRLASADSPPVPPDPASLSTESKRPSTSEKPAPSPPAVPKIGDPLTKLKAAVETKAKGATPPAIEPKPETVPTPSPAPPEAKAEPTVPAIPTAPPDAGPPIPTIEEPTAPIPAMPPAVEDAPKPEPKDAPKPEPKDAPTTKVEPPMPADPSPPDPGVAALPESPAPPTGPMPKPSEPPSRDAPKIEPAPTPSIPPVESKPADIGPSLLPMPDPAPSPSPRPVEPAPAPEPAPAVVARPGPSRSAESPTAPPAAEASDPAPAEPAPAQAPADVVSKFTSSPLDAESASGATGGARPVHNMGKRRPIESTPEARLAPERAVADAPMPREEVGARDRIDPILHTVESGENFWTISRLYYSSGRYYKALHAANRRLVPKIAELYVGTTIKVPPIEALDPSLIYPPSRSRANDDAATRTGRSSPSSTARAARPSADGRRVPSRGRPSAAGSPRSRARDDVDEPTMPTYRVRPHDTLRSIARDTLGDPHRYREILELNRDAIDDPTRLDDGLVLTLPDDAAVRAR